MLIKDEGVEQEEECKALQQNDVDNFDQQTDQLDDNSPPNLKFSQTINQQQMPHLDSTDLKDTIDQSQIRSKSPNQLKRKVKNLRALIQVLKQDKVKQEIIKNNPDMEQLSQEHAHLFKDELRKSIPKKSQLNNLPLKHKLALLEKFKLDPKDYLDKSELAMIKFENSYFIPDQIKITNLKKLLHKSVTKVNKWIKHSLKGTYQHDFDYFMQNDKTIVDKNSLQYQQLVDEQRAREILSQKLEASKGGYIDPNMRAIDLTHRKIINDILNKFQMKNHLVLPIFDERRNQMDIKLQDIEKLQAEILREHEEIERKLSALKEKKFNKWKILNQEFKKRQATLGQVHSPSPEISPSMSVDNLSSPRVARQKQQRQIQTQLNKTQQPQQLNNQVPTILINNQISPRNKQDSPTLDSPTNQKTIPQIQSQFSSNGKVGQKFREYLMERLDKQRNEELMKQLDEELENQCRMLKCVDKDIEEFQYYMVKKQNGEMTFEDDPLLPDDLYIKSGKKKHFAQNIAVWKQQEIIEDLKNDFDSIVKKFRILQSK